MQFRHEWKHEIDYAGLLVLRSRLRAVMKRDEHADAEGKYRIRSLYFDTPGDTALREKIAGVNRREKFRLRCYNGDTERIWLEKKSKLNGLCSKEKTPLSRAEAERLLSGDISWMAGGDDPLLHELYCKMRTRFLRPKTVVEYTREPFVFAPGNVRVTLDYDIRTALTVDEFLSDASTFPAGDAPIILEVKWDEFLPSVIRDAVQLPFTRSAAFSKYAQCRIYG